MKCSSIKLANRTEERVIFQKDQPRCHPVLLENDNNHGYRLTSSSNARSDEQSDYGQPYLSVLNIMLPKNVKAFNTGSSINRWANKRPRLKSGKKDKTTEFKFVDVDNLNVPNLLEELQYDATNDIDGNLITIDECEVDPDIRRLLEDTHVEETLDISENKRISFDFDESESKRTLKTKRKQKKNSKEKRKDKEKKHKSKVKKTVSFSVSKPPTPQTEQVIRVDVVSNHSIEFETLESNRTDCILSPCDEVLTQNCCYDKSDQFVFELCCIEKFDESKNLYLESKKAVLFPRAEK